MLGSGQLVLSPTSPDGYYRLRSMLTVKAIPGAGAQFLQWRGTNPASFGFSIGTDTFTFPVMSSYTMQAEFTTLPVTTVDGPLNSQVVIDGVARALPAKYVWTAGSQHTLSLVDTTLLDKTSSSRLLFESWEDGSTALSRSIVAGGGAATYRVNYQLQNYFYFAFKSGGVASRFPASVGGSGFYGPAAQVTITATPNPGSTFHYWLGDVGGSDNPKTLTLDRTKGAVATFGPAQPFRIMSAASYGSSPQFDLSGSSVAPLEIAFMQGTNLGPAALTVATQNPDGSFPTRVAGTRILFDDIPAPIVYVSSQYTTVVVPQEVAGKTAAVVKVERDGVVVATSTVGVAESFPSLFTSDASGSGQVAALNQDYSVNSPSRPAAAGSIIVLYGTGSGLLTGALPNGSLTVNTVYRTALPVSVRIGSEVAKVEYAGSAPYLVHGALQVNVRLPDNLPSGPVPVQLVIGNNTSVPFTTLSIE